MGAPGIYHLRGVLAPGAGDSLENEVDESLSR